MNHLNSDFKMREQDHISLCEALDRVLNKGAVIVGDLTISVANVDLIYLGLQVILTSVETARESVSENKGAVPRIKLGLGTGVMIDESIRTDHC
jgi:hypothetical protein